jgi:acetoin utilization protein AcuB
MTMRVEDCMTRSVVSVKPRDSVAHARAIMEERRINQLPVLEGPRLVGIVTDRDLRDTFPSVLETVGRRRRSPKSADPATIAVEDVMAHDVLTAAPGDSLASAAQLVRRQRIGALPVIQGGRLVGILTRSDLLQALVRLLGEEP